LVGLNRAGAVVVRRKFSRLQLLRFTANLRVRLIGMESCGGSHFLGRALREQGHEVRLNQRPDTFAQTQTVIFTFRLQYGGGPYIPSGR
jgi:hypothetical protein